MAVQPAVAVSSSSSSSYNIAGCSTETPVLSGRKLRWSDELDRVNIRNSSNANYQAQLVQQLQQLRDTHSPLGINMKIRQNRRFVLDRFKNEDIEHGCSYLLPDGTTVTGNFASDSGATFSLVNKNWCHRVGLNYSLTDIKLKLADTSMGRVIGITDPVWCIIAKGTPNEALGMAQALVMEDCPEDLDGLMAKDVLHTMDAWVDQRAQLFCYKSTAGHRCSVPVECFVEYTATVAAPMYPDGAAATADSGVVLNATASNEVFTAYACAGLSDFNVAVTTTDDAADRTATPTTTNGECKGPTDSLPADTTNTGGVEMEGRGTGVTLPVTPGLAAHLAASAGGTREQPGMDTAGQQGGTSAAGVSPDLNPIDEEQDTEPPPLYFRVHATVSQWLVAIAMLLLVETALLAVACMGMPRYEVLSLLSYATDDKGWWTRLFSWLQQKRKRPQFTLPPITGNRPRKKERGDWIAQLCRYANTGKLLTASLRRHAKRYNLAVQTYCHERGIYRAVTVDKGWGFKLGRPILLLALTSLLACAMATPDGINGLHQMTDNLAAWELSQLAGWRFLSSGRLQLLPTFFTVWYSKCLPNRGVYGSRGSRRCHRRRRW